MTDPSCETCRFAKINWHKGDEFEVAGVKQIKPRQFTSVQCRINPPTQSSFDQGQDGWPWITADEWCGSWQPKAALIEARMIQDEAA